MSSQKYELTQRLLTHLQEIVRERDPYFASEGHFYVQHYIRQQFEQWGIVETHDFQVKGRTHHNLIMNLPSQKTQQSQSPLLIAAHYDAVPKTPGADDNATGIAVLLELARIFATNPSPFPIRFVAFDMEEYGLLGSQAYVRELKKQRQSLRLMLSLEMLGYCDATPGCQNYPVGLKFFYPNQGDFITLVGNLRTVPDMQHLRRHFRQNGTPCECLPIPFQGLPIPMTRFSDHSPFWDAGYRALMVTDTSFLRNPHYHKLSDTLETLDLNFLTGVCQGLAIGIGSLR